MIGRPNAIIGIRIDTATVLFCEVVMLSTASVKPRKRLPESPKPSD